jgi:hypothetical protein
MKMTRRMWTLGVPVLIAGCVAGGEPTTGQTGDLPIFSTAGMRVSAEGIIDFGTTVFSTNPTTLLEPLDFHAYDFDGRAGGTVTITAQSSPTCGDPNLVIDLFTADDFDAGGVQLIENDNDSLPCSTDSRISNFTLPISGTYVVLVRSFRQAGTSSGRGHYQLTLTCTNGACALPGSPNAATVRVNQADIDAGRFTPEDLFEIGDFTFEHVFTVAEGLGNALPGAPGNGTARPAFRNIPNNVHFAAFGAPEAQSCVTCHNSCPAIGFGGTCFGNYGAGDDNHITFQIGDGINRASGVPRSPPAVLGNGLRQRAGEEMTAELQSKLAAGKAQAKSSLTNATVALTTKTVNFGSVIARPDGTVDFTSLSGVDTDLVVKPFGWKGREATLRRFVEGSFRVHFGMESDPQIKANCPNNSTGLPLSVNTVGNANCPDPDGDGLFSETTEGQLSAMAVYMGLAETPVRVPAISAAAQTRVQQGEQLFNQVFCGGCHRQNITINVPVHTEKADTTGGAGITIDLRTANHDPKPAVNADGSMTIEVFTDFKRHKMGPSLADSKNFNQIAADEFITPPLWGIRDSAPYLHDGRARTLLDAVLLHGEGEDKFSVDSFKALSADDQQKIVEFMESLGREEDRVAGKVDMSNFLLQQIRPVGGGFFSLTNISFPGGTLVAHGGRVIIARNSPFVQDFQNFYGRTLDANTLFITGGNIFPVINGSEQFGLFDSNGDFTTANVGIDGFTFPVGAGQTLQRRDCGLIAPQSASWTFVASTPQSATPGITGPNTHQNRICFTEVADSPTNSNFEFVEIFIE